MVIPAISILLCLPVSLPCGIAKRYLNGMVHFRIYCGIELSVGKAIFCAVLFLVLWNEFTILPTVLFFGFY